MRTQETRLKLTHGLPPDLIEEQIAKATRTQTIANFPNRSTDRIFQRQIRLFSHEAYPTCYKLEGPTQREVAAL